MKTTDDIYFYLKQFWRNTQFTSTCWLWKRSGSDRYGRMSIGDHFVSAHRWAYEAFVGPIPEGMQLDHLCRQSRCVNPNHLEPVTPRENLLRGDGRPGINARKTHCKQGHAFDEFNTYWLPNGKGRACKACRSAWTKAHPEIHRKAVRESQARRRAKQHTM